MRRTSLLLTILSLVCAAQLSAQGRGPMPAGPGGGTPLGVPGVEMLLSQTGALQLTDAQVVRLAAIARRAEDRRRALRTQLDSLRPRRMPGDSAGRRERVTLPTDLFDRERDASHADLRDALAVLNADQQARAWEMIAMRGAPRPGPRGGMMRDGRGGGGRDGRDDGAWDDERQPRRPGGAGPERRRPGSNDAS